MKKGKPPEKRPVKAPERTVAPAPAPPPAPLDLATGVEPAAGPSARFPIVGSLFQGPPLGIGMLVRLVQSWNVSSPMLVTLFPIVTLVRLVQPANAEFPMLVTLLGMVTLVRLVQ